MKFDTANDRHKKRLKIGRKILKVGSATEVKIANALVNQNSETQV